MQFAIYLNKFFLIISYVRCYNVINHFVNSYYLSTKLNLVEMLFELLSVN